MLKKLIALTCVCAAIYSPAFSQTATPTPIATTESPKTTSFTDIACVHKGNFVIGARLGFSANRSTVTVEGTSTAAVNSGTQTATQFSITPNIGYFFADRFVLGIGMDYLRTSSDDNATTTTTDGSSSDSRLLFGPSLRYYFPVTNDQAFFLGIVSGFGTSNTKVNVDNKTQTINTNIKSFGFGPGYTIFSSRCIAMEAQMKYNFGSTNSKIDISGIQQTTNSKNNAFDFVVGVSYYFGR